MPAAGWINLISYTCPTWFLWTRWREVPQNELLLKILTEIPFFKMLGNWQKYLFSSMEGKEGKDGFKLVSCYGVIWISGREGWFKTSLPVMGSSEYQRRAPWIKGDSQDQAVCSWLKESIAVSRSLSQDQGVFKLSVPWCRSIHLDLLFRNKTQWQ